MGRVAVGLGEAAGVEVGSPFAMLVDLPAVGELGASQFVELGDLFEGEVVEDRGEEVVGGRRASRDVDDRLVLDDVPDAERAGRVRGDRLDPAVGGAAPDADDGGRPFRRVVQRLQRGLSGDLAEDPVLLGRDGTFHDQDVLAVVLPHGVVERLLGLGAGSGHQRFVVIERDHVQDQRGNGRVRGAQERFRTTGAFLEMKPDHRRVAVPLNRFRYLRVHSKREPHHGRGGYAGLHKTPAGDPLTKHLSILVHSTSS